MGQLKNKAHQSTQLLYLSPDSLLTHPKNLRTIYPDNQISEMAESIRAVGGVIQALRIVSCPKSGKYYVVDGNMRLAGARLLGRECPPLKCELVSESEAKQLLTMVVTAKFRYDPDPISEAIHYKRLKEEENYSIDDIAQATGLNYNTITFRLNLLKLDSEIQDLIRERKLPADHKAVQAFLAISDSRARVKLAQRLATDKVTVRAIVASCERLINRMKDVEIQVKKGAPALAIGQGRTFGKSVSNLQTFKTSKIRMAAEKMCDSCNVRESSLAKLPEPAWSLIVHSSEETCGHCSVREVKSACGECPGVDLIRNLILSVEKHAA